MEHLWIARSSKELLSSSEGMYWTSVEGSRRGRSLLVHGGSLWIISGLHDSGSLYASDDGLSWPYVTSRPHQELTDFTSLSFDGKIWILGGSYIANEGEGFYDYFEGEGASSYETFVTQSVPATSDQKKGEKWEGEFCLKSRISVASKQTWYEIEDVWSYETGNGWNLVTCAPWGPRQRHASVVFDGKMWVLGGSSTVTGEWVELNDVWSSEDGLTWTQVTAAAPWCPRSGLAAVVYHGKIWVLGGGDRNDVWCSEDGANWTQVTNQAPWARRSAHSCVVHDDKIWLLSGWQKYDVWNYEGPGEGEGEGDGAGEGTPPPVRFWHVADTNTDHVIGLSELLRTIQFFNSDGYQCEPCTEDDYVVGFGETDCHPHDADYNPQDWEINLSELLRVIQIFNFDGYRACPEEGSEDGFCLGMEQ